MLSHYDFLILRNTILTAKILGQHFMRMTYMLCFHPQISTCACPVSLNVLTPVAASPESSVVMDRTTAERERMRKTAVSVRVLI